jgi:hypothetical protein
MVSSLCREEQRVGIVALETGEELGCVGPLLETEFAARELSRVPPWVKGVRGVAMESLVSSGLGVCFVGGSARMSSSDIQTMGGSRLSCRAPRNGQKGAKQIWFLFSKHKANGDSVGSI